MKKIVRLTESDLVKLVKKVIKEQVNSEQPDFTGKIPRGPHTIVRDARLGPNKGRVVPNAPNPSTGNPNTFKPFDTSYENLIRTEKIDIAPTQFCVPQDKVQRELGRGVKDVTDSMIANQGDLDLRGNVFYVWEGNGMFRITQVERPHLINVCAGKRNGVGNNGIKRYIEKMGIRNVNTEPQ